MPDAVSTTEADLCGCDRFHLWYTGDDGTSWCRCGHADDEHINNRGTCTGTVEVRR